VELEAVALVPLADELPPPEPKPWKEREKAQDDTNVRPTGQQSKGSP
jgi:hypothetical protein